MAISEMQQDKLAALRSARNKQDSKQPFVINRRDGRLLPNTPLMRKHKDYMPYTGSVKATLAERMKFITTGSSHRPVVLAQEEGAPEVFDIGTASKEDLIGFAFNEYGAVLNEKAPRHILAAQVNKLALAAQASTQGTPVLDESLG